MNNNLIAEASVMINAPAEQVWKGLTDPALVKQYMMGAEVESDWEPGSPITWKGEFKGKSYTDKGEILEIMPGKKLKYTHFSPMSGAADKPENYHTVTVELDGGNRRTTVTLSQDNNANSDAKKESEKNWLIMLEGLKKVVEEGE